MRPDKFTMVSFQQNQVRNIMAGRQTEHRTPFYTPEDCTYIHGTIETGYQFSTHNGKGFKEMWWPHNKTIKHPHYVDQILAVRETVRVAVIHNIGKVRKFAMPGESVITIIYESDGEVSTPMAFPGRLKPVELGHCIPNGCFKEAARTFLRVTAIGAERVQDISWEDSLMEGVSIQDGNYCGRMYRDYSKPDGVVGFHSPRSSFASMWDTIYTGDKSWAANPMTWVTRFEVME